LKSRQDLLSRLPHALLTRLPFVPWLVQELREVGCAHGVGSPGSLSEALGVCDPFDVVLDNNGKDMAAVQ